MSETTRKAGVLALSLQQQINNLDPEKRIAAITPTALPSPLPSADRGEFFLFNQSGNITINGVSYDVTAGDRLWCSTDDTPEGNEGNWEFLPAPLKEELRSLEAEIEGIRGQNEPLTVDRILLYVAQYGNDGNDGLTVDTAVKTLDRAIALYNSDSRNFALSLVIVVRGVISQSEILYLFRLKGTNLRIVGDTSYTTPPSIAFSQNAFIYVSGNKTLSVIRMEFNASPSAGARRVFLVEAGGNLELNDVTFKDLSNYDGILLRNNTQLAILKSFGGKNIINSSFPNYFIRAEAGCSVFLGVRIEVQGNPTIGTLLEAISASVYLSNVSPLFLGAFTGNKFVLANAASLFSAANLSRQNDVANGGTEVAIPVGCQFDGEVVIDINGSATRTKDAIAALEARIQALENS